MMNPEWELLTSVGVPFSQEAKPRHKQSPKLEDRRSFGRYCCEICGSWNANLSANCQLEHLQKCY